VVQNQKTELLTQQKKGSKSEKIKPQNPRNALFSGFSAVSHCINFVVAMFPCNYGYFPDFLPISI
jgi:hypothetical protein